MTEPSRRRHARRTAKSARSRPRASGARERAVAATGRPRAHEAPMQRTRARAHVRDGVELEGAEPVGVRAHALLPPQAGRRQPHRPDPASRSSRSSPKQVAPYGYDEHRPTTHQPQHAGQAPTLRTGTLRHRPARPRLPEPRHLRHPDVALGRDLRRAALDRRSARPSARSPATTAARSTTCLMRFTDLILTVPGLAVLLSPQPTSARAVEVSLGDHVAIPQPMKIGLILAFLFWIGHRAHRARRLPLAAREGVRRGGEGGRRRRPAHHHPAHPPELRRPDRRQHDAHHRRRRSSIEAALSFLGFGIQPPNPSLGKLIADGQSEGFDTWWLVTFPGLVITDRSRSASTSSATACATRSTRRSGRSPLPERALADADPHDPRPDGRVQDRGRHRAGRHRRQLRPRSRARCSASSASRARARASRCSRCSG